MKDKDTAVQADMMERVTFDATHYIEAEARMIRTYASQARPDYIRTVLARIRETAAVIEADIARCEA